MFLSDFSIRRPMAMVVIIIALMCVGLLALKSLRVNQVPDVQEPVLVVSIPYPGASPETVEREIVNRVEKSLQSISGVKRLNATASESNARLVIFFNFDKNMIEAADEVRNAIASVRHKLPIEMREPILQRIDPAQQPIMQLALSSSVQGHADISRLVEDDLAERIRGVDGVAAVNIHGALNRELSVLLHAQRLREYNVSVADVVQALRHQNTTAPVGKIKGELDEKSIRLVGRIESPAEFEQVVVRRRGDEVVRLGQIATVVDGFAELTSVSLRNGHPNVGMSIQRSREASTVTVANDIRKLVDEINQALPRETRLDITQDGGEEAENSLNNVTHALIFGAGLTIFVVYVFLNSWRSTLITALSLPTSVLTAFIAVWLSGFTLNFMTLLGLSLAIGVLIDDAIVVRENIVRHMELGADRITAASVGTKEIGLAVAATTFSIVAVFIPVAFMPGVAGEWFRPFALTVASSVMVSLFISFTLDPMLSAYWGDPVGHHLQPRRGLSLWLAKFNTWFDHQCDRSAIAIARDLRLQMNRLIGAEYVVLEDLNNGASKPVQIHFFGEDSRRLMTIANDFMEKLRQVKGAVDVGLSEQDPKDELKIELHRGLANSLGISVGDAAQALRVAFAGVEVGDWVDPSGVARDVAVRLHPDDRVSAENIERLPIAVGGSSMMVPLEQIATITLGKGPSHIEHSDGKRMIAVSTNVEGRSPGEVTADAMKIARAIDFPPGYGIELGGASRDQQEVFSKMLTALVMGIGLMYLILVMQFGSFTAPLGVMLSLPLSLIGVVLALLSTGGTLNLMSFIGIIMLMGLVAKNAILLLDAARKREQEGFDREDALMHAGRMRLRPILMTTFALVAGMLPVAIGIGEGGEFYRPMAVAIIGGTITSTILTLLVVPSFYDSIEIARDRMFTKFRMREARGNALTAFVLTLVEAILTLVFVRFIYRFLKEAATWATGRRGVRAA